MSETKTIEIVAGYSGKVGNIHGDQYGSESPFFSSKEIIEDWQGTDDEKQRRQLELAIEVNDMYNAWKEEAQRPKIVKHAKPDPICFVDAMEITRQNAIALITEHLLWYEKSGNKNVAMVIFKDMFNMELDGDLQKLPWYGARRLEKKLYVWQHRLNGNEVKKTKEKA